MAKQKPDIAPKDKTRVSQEPVSKPESKLPGVTHLPLIYRRVLSAPGEYSVSQKEMMDESYGTENTQKLLRFLEQNDAVMLDKDINARLPIKTQSEPFDEEGTGGEYNPNTGTVHLSMRPKLPTLAWQNMQREAVGEEVAHGSALDWRKPGEYTDRMVHKAFFGGEVPEDPKDRISGVTAGSGLNLLTKDIEPDLDYHNMMEEIRAKLQNSGRLKGIHPALFMEDGMSYDDAVEKTLDILSSQKFESIPQLKVWRVGTPDQKRILLNVAKNVWRNFAQGDRKLPLTT